MACSVLSVTVGHIAGPMVRFGGVSQLGWLAVPLGVADDVRGARLDSLSPIG